MAKKAKAALPAKTTKDEREARPNVLQVRVNAGDTKAQREAELMVEGLAMNAVVGVTFSQKLGTLDLTEAFAQVLVRAREITGHDTESTEAILAGQVMSLNAIYTDLAIIARQNISNAIIFERLMRLALKAQSNCRATAEALAAIQNPPTVFARQANFAAGPQQINNGLASIPVARARNSESRPNELLEANDERVDSGTPSAAIDRNQDVATVGAIDRPSDHRR